MIKCGLILAIVFTIVSCATVEKPLYKEQMDYLFPKQSNMTATSTPVAKPEVTQQDQPIVVQSIDYIEPTKTPKKDEVDPLKVVNNNTKNYTVEPHQETFDGGAVLYQYIPNTIYKIFTAPLMTTDIALEPGERQISPVVCGDTQSFMKTDSKSLVSGKEQQHILIKAVFPEKKTTLTVFTDRRVYQFKLLSFENTYMPIITFNYPIDSRTATLTEAAKLREDIKINGSITDLAFNYEIIPMTVNAPHWMPSKVFSDRSRTYIYFAAATRASYAPVLFSIENGKRVLVNYIVSGDYYIVDRILDHAELVMDVNGGNIVTIKRVNL